MTAYCGARVKIACPVCGQPCPIPFYRGSLEARVHRQRTDRDSTLERCRFIVSVDPIGDDHTFRVLDRTERFEDVDGEMWDRHEQRVRAAIFAECLAQTREGRAA